MPRIAFQKPRKTEWEILTDRYGREVAEPFEKGYALTVGNSLRRALLSIIPGAAITWMRIEGVADAESRIPGVKENTTEVLLNLKKLAVQVPSDEPKRVRLDVTGPREVTGADVPEADGIEVLNPELHLFTLVSGRVTMDLGIGVGRGYVAADAQPRGAVPAGAIPFSACPTTWRCRASARSSITKSWCSRSGRTARSPPTRRSCGPPRTSSSTSPSWRRKARRRKRWKGRNRARTTCAKRWRSRSKTCRSPRAP
ncbi:MAG: hypothetical protein DMD82_08985 [Candidatus Rokuibacteriota bacterium]|nr:MAG: hypothetical protein DMD82_08985 [Candidatus Rokubacteria bacterium]